MAIQTMLYAACAGGAATVSLRYDDQTNVITAIVAANDSGAPVTFAITDPGTGVSVSRTWETGTSETVAVPGGFRFVVEDTGMMTSRFTASFGGSGTGG